MKQSSGTSPPDWRRHQRPIGWTSAQRRAKAWSTGYSQTTATNIMLNGQRLEEVDNLQHLASILSKADSSTKQIHTSLTQTSSIMTRLVVILRSRVISFPVTMPLFKALPWWSPFCCMGVLVCNVWRGQEYSIPQGPRPPCTGVELVLWV